MVEFNSFCGIKIKKTDLNVVESRYVQMVREKGYRYGTYTYNRTTKQEGYTLGIRDVWGMSCHRDITNGVGIDQLVTQYDPRTPSSIEYLEYLLDETGPFSSLFVHSPKDQWSLMWDEERKIISGISFPDALVQHKPLWEVLYSFLVMTRDTENHSGMIPSWLKLHSEYGMSKAYAYLLSYRLRFLEYKFKPSASNWDACHCVFNENLGPVDIRAFAEGRFHNAITVG